MQALLPLFPELLLQLPSRVFTATSLLLLAYLGPAMWYLWMDLGTGNANFFYAITLLWSAWQVNAMLVHLLLDTCCVLSIELHSSWQASRNCPSCLLVKPAACETGVTVDGVLAS